jgi:hypothetical protein
VFSLELILLCYCDEFLWNTLYLWCWSITQRVALLTSLPPAKTLPTATDLVPPTTQKWEPPTWATSTLHPILVTPTKHGNNIQHTSSWDINSGRMASTVLGQEASRFLDMDICQLSLMWEVPTDLFTFFFLDHDFDLHSCEEIATYT